MAKLTGPLMSMTASGKFANSIVFVQAKSGPVARQFVIPSNPKSASQTGVRAMMAWISQEWAKLTAPEKATWLTAIATPGESAFNAFVRSGMNQWKNGLFAQSEHPSIVEAAPAVPTALVATAAGRQVTFTWVDPAARVFGLALHSTLGGVNTPSPANAIKVADAGVLQAVFTFAAPGTYHYRLRAASHEGLFGPATADATIVVS